MENSYNQEGMKPLQEDVSGEEYEVFDESEGDLDSQMQKLIQSNTLPRERRQN